MESTSFTIVSLIISFFGGGVISAAINCIRVERADKKNRKIEFLNGQIRKLYGPLYYFISQSEKLFELNEKIHNAYKAEYIAKQYSTDELTRKHLEQETSETLNIANEYIICIENNNLKIKEILDKNYSFIDPDDIELFLVFYEHYVRLVTERDDEGRLKTPLIIYKHIGDISFLSPEVIERVKAKFLEKKEKLEELLKK